MVSIMIILENRLFHTAFAKSYLYKHKLKIWVADSMCLFSVCFNRVEREKIQTSR